MSEKTSSGANQTLASSKELSKLAIKLNSLVTNFKV